MGDTGHQRQCPGKVNTTQNDDEWSWTNKIQPISVTFSGQSGLKNMPANISAESDMTDFLNLFLDTELLNKMVEYTNSRAEQTKTDKPNDYYAQRWFNVTVAEMRAFVGV